MEKIDFQKVNKLLASSNVRWLSNGFTIATNSLLTDRKIRPADKIVYLVLLMHTFRKGDCFISLRRLAEEIGYGHTQIKKSVDKLKEIGYIKIIGRKNKANHYVIYGK